MSTTTTPEDWANLLKELCWQVARLAWALVGLFYKAVGIVVPVLYLTGHLAVRYIP